MKTNVVLLKHIMYTLAKPTPSGIAFARSHPKRPLHSIPTQGISDEHLDTSPISQAREFVPVLNVKAKTLRAFALCTSISKSQITTEVQTLFRSNYEHS